MREQLEFLLFDGMMIAISTMALTLAHSGILFPATSMLIKEKLHHGSAGGVVGSKIILSLLSDTVKKNEYHYLHIVMVSV